MRLQTKTALCILPLVAVAILSLGTWSVLITTRNLRNSMETLMALELSEYIDHSLERMHGVLEKNRLTKVDSFVKKYQEHALAEAEEVHYFRTSHLIILNEPGEVVFCSQHRAKEAQELWRSAAALIAAKPDQEVRGELRSSRGREIYVGRYFKPWGWSVIYSISADEVNAPAMRIRNATVGIALLCIACGFLLIFLLFRQFLIRPVSTLKDAAKAVAKREEVESIGIRSKDELGELARSMEEMAGAIKEYRIRQENWQKHLEEEVRDRTRDLKNTNLALREEITVRKKTEEELERSNRELDDFAYIASHDLKEPLRGIANYSGFLMEDYADRLDEEGHAKLETLIRLARRQESLIESLLEYSRVGRTQLAFEAVDLDKVVRNVTDSVMPSFEKQNVHISIPEPLPTVWCDGVRIGEVFYNLITNGVKYNDKPEKRIEIGFTTADSLTAAKRKEAARHIFHVRDNGIGIPEKHREKIFTIFKRLHGRDKFGGGTGAGLTIVKKIVERHGGEIRVESSAGEGTTFYFTLEQGEDDDGTIQTTDPDR